MLQVYKNLYENVRKLIGFIQHIVNELNLIYQKKDSIYKITKDYKPIVEMGILGKALGTIYILDNILANNERIQKDWALYQRMIKIIKPDASKYSATDY